MLPNYGELSTLEIYRHGMWMNQRKLPQVTLGGIVCCYQAGQAHQESGDYVGGVWFRARLLLKVPKNFCNNTVKSG